MLFTKENKIAVTILATMIILRYYFDAVGQLETFFQGAFYFFLILVTIYGISSYFKKSKGHDEQKENS